MWTARAHKETVLKLSEKGWHGKQPTTDLEGGLCLPAARSYGESRCNSERDVGTPVRATVQADSLGDGVIAAAEGGPQAEIVVICGIGAGSRCEQQQDQVNFNTNLEGLIGHYGEVSSTLPARCSKH